MEPDLPLIHGDREALIEVLMNLIDNAIKYSLEEKFISISTHSDKINVFIEITDHGIRDPAGTAKVCI